MKRTVVRLFAFFITAAMIFSLSVCFASAEDSGDIIVLFTNDVHCATESYALLAAYREEYISQGHTVITVDAGDAIQGKMIGTLTQGEAIVEIMNLVGYDIAIPGNHEFDYKVETLMSLSESAEYEYICANFYDIVNEKQVFSPYKIIDIGSEKIAFVGIATPETYTKSTPAYFQNENGEFIYSFMEDSFYDTIQSATDSAVSEGATMSSPTTMSEIATSYCADLLPILSGLKTKKPLAEPKAIVPSLRRMLLLPSFSSRIPDDAP